jgi:hypothetical protein
MEEKEVKITYTARAWGQDSGLAMKADVMYALVELVTNCDDAYARAKTSGPIEIIVRRFPKTGAPTEITVRDHAHGLDPDAMIAKLTKMGGDESGFDVGEDVRGLFSRGAKDTADFGETVFETIRDGVYSTLTLRISENMTTKLSHCPADDKHYKALGLSVGENGFSATLRITKSGVKVPDLRTLIQRLSTHIQLRRIMSLRDVMISDYRDGKMTQSLPVVWEEPTSTLLLDEEIDIPGYDATARLTISQLAERSDGPVGPYSMHGIEIRGGRASYMNDMFGQTSPSCGLITGVVVCTAIDDLIREHVKGQGNEKNPTCLVSRIRDGIEKEHPFTQSLTVAVLEKLKPILEGLEPKVEESGSPELKKDLGSWAELLAEELKTDLDDDEDNGVGGLLPSVTNPIVVIPPTLRARLGSKRTVTVLVLADSVAANGIQASVTKPVCQPIGVIGDLLAHPTFPNTLVGQLRLEMTSLGSTTVVVIAVDDPKVSGSGEVVVHDDDDPETEPTTLEWKNPLMSVTVGKTRSVRLRAPLTHGPNGELLASITLESDHVHLEDREVKLTLVSSGWLEAKVHVSGVSFSKEAALIVATAGSVSAEGSVRTTLPNPTGGLNIDIEVLNEAAGSSRGRMREVDTGLLLSVYAKHKWMAARLGVRKSDVSFTRDKELDARVAMIEVIASVAADFALARKVKKDPNLYSDVDEIIFERQRITDRYLRILMQGLDG